MRRRILLAVLGLVLVALGVTAWSGWRALQVRDDLTLAQTIADSVQRELSTGDVDRAESALPALRISIDRAADRANGPIWSVAQRVPLLGNNFRAVRRTTLAAQVLGRDALPEATAALQLVRRSKPVHDGRIDLAVLAQLRPHLDRAVVAGDRAQELLARPDGYVLGKVGNRVTAVRDKVAQLDSALRAGQKALGLAPVMLGADGPRTYYIAVQNNAEARATGGLIGAFALVTADKGKITLDRTGTDTELVIANSPVPSDPAAAVTWTDEGSTRAWFDANLTPHFPDAARNIAGQWTAQSGQKLDGVIALDPLVMSELLKTTGPVKLPDGLAVTADSVVDFVGHDEYIRYTDVPRRKLLLSTLARDLFNQVIAAKDSVATLQALARAGSSGHLFVWSAHPQDQAALGAGLVSGLLPPKDVPYLNVLTQNFGGNKLDFYVRRTVAISRHKDGFVDVMVTLRNTAPTGLPLYMTVRSDQPEPPVPYGQAKVGFSVYAALSSEISAVRVDGRPAPMTFDKDHGHRFGTMSLELPRNKNVVVTMRVREPKGELIYRQQPLVVPDTLAIEVPHRVQGR